MATTKTPKAPKAAKTPKTQTKSATIDKSALPSKVGYYIHYVPDMAKAVEFFKNIGLKPMFDSPEWSEFDAGIKFALHGMECSEKGHTHAGIETNITFSVKNCDETIAAFKTLGVKITSEPRQVCDEGRCFSFQDPFGNTFSCYGK